MTLDTYLIHGIKSVMRQNPLPHLRESFSRSFPEATIKEVHKHYWWWHYDEMRAIVREIVGEADDRECLLVGHSMGGLIALAAAQEIPGVRGVVMIFSPYATHGGKFRRELVPHENKNVPIISFGAAFDHVVPYYGTRHPRSLQHEVFWTDHVFGLTRTRRYTDRIAHIAAQHFL